MENESIWNKNREEGRDLNSLEKKGIEKLREKDSVYASFVERNLPLLDASIKFLDKIIADAKSKLEENKKIANDLKKQAAKNKDEDGKEAPAPMIYDEAIANALIKEGGTIKGEITGDIVALSQAVISGEKTISKVTLVYAAMEVPKINPNEDKDKDKDKDKDGNEGGNKTGDGKENNQTASPYKKDVQTPEENENVQDKSSEKEDIVNTSTNINTGTNKKVLSKEKQEAKMIAEKSGILKPKTPKANTNPAGINKENTNTGETKNARPAPVRNAGR